MGGEHIVDVEYIQIQLLQGKKYDFPMVKSYYFPCGEIVFKTFIFSVLGKNLNYHGKNLIFNNIIGGQIVECMYEI